MGRSVRRGIYPLNRAYNRTMFRRHGLISSTLLLLSMVTLAQTRAASDLQIQTQPLPSARIGRPYSATLQATGGTPPLQWKLTKGTLPPGVDFQPTIGTLSGTPTAPGDYNFTISVTDSAGNRISGDFIIRIEDYLAVRWKEGPRLNENTIAGTVEVSNGSRDIYDQTVIIVAVNEIGKAFALGYQHFNLSSQSQQVIPYSSSLPNGHYLVHVDAVAEIPARHIIRRARLQTQQAIEVNVNR
jgi:hypothetical protein